MLTTWQPLGWQACFSPRLPYIKVCRPGTRSRQGSLTSQHSRCQTAHSVLLLIACQNLLQTASPVASQCHHRGKLLSSTQGRCGDSSRTLQAGTLLRHRTPHLGGDLLRLEGVASASHPGSCAVLKVRQVLPLAAVHLQLPRCLQPCHARSAPELKPSRLSPGWLVLAARRVVLEPQGCGDDYSKICA